MSNVDCWQWDATALAAAIRQRELSCREAVESCLARLAEVNPQINAVVEVLADTGLAAADAADAALKRGDTVGPLHGVPVTTKINVDQAGVATSNGVVAYKNLIATDDSPPVRNWRNAGAIMLGRTNAPAFSLRWFTCNDLHGLTRNPNDFTLNVGGSSGGAAAAVATGIGPLAHGNDLAGSVRLPAGACGVYGLRPTTGRIPAFNGTAQAERSIILQLGSTQGVLARSVRDLRLGFDAMSVRDARDPLWMPAPMQVPAEAQNKRVALFAGDSQFTIQPAVAEQLHQAAEILHAAGYEVEYAAPPRFAEAADTWMTLLTNHARSAAAQAALQLGDAGYQRSYQLTQACLPTWSADELLDGLALRTTLMRAWHGFFEKYPLLLLPTSWALPAPLDYDLRGKDETRELLNANSPCTATAFLGLPAVSVPVGRYPQLPIGVQLVAARFRDAWCLQAAQIIEQSLGPVQPFAPRVSS